MSEHPAKTFIHRFHAHLTHWFAGTGSREQTWAFLERASPAEMVLVYPSGTRLTGASFLETIRERYGSSPGFVASIHDLEIVAEAKDHYVVAYIEAQKAATASAGENRRSALAVVTRSEPLRFRFIQETGC